LLSFRFFTVNTVKARSDRPKNAAKIAIVGNSGVAGDALVVDVGELVVDVGATVEVGEELFIKTGEELAICIASS